MRKVVVITVLKKYKNIIVCIIHNLLIYSKLLISKHKIIKIY